MSELQSYQPKIVVVSIARPDTAPRLLELASSLIDRDEGRILALTVGSDDDDKEVLSENVETVEAFVMPYRNDGFDVEVITQLAPSITRGILDATRDYGADALILGMYKPAQRRVELGNIVENVISAATCDVLVYRMSKTTPTYERVVVPVDGSANSVTALNNGVFIAKSHNIHLYPLYIQRDFDFNGEREAQISEALDELDPDYVHKEVIAGRNPSRRVLDMLTDDDLLVLGFHQRSQIDDQLQNEITDTLLNRAQGPVLLASHLTPRSRDSVMGFLMRRLQRYNPALTQVERNELTWQSQKTSMASLDYLLLILLSAAIASFGLLLNSVAVIIGAMLVAPLMSPLGALSTGLATGRTDIVGRSAVTLIVGFVMAVVTSWVIGMIVFIEQPTSEMLGRGMPSLIDAGVAVSGGIVAAFALARKEISTALAGVAIAAALMPPICTVGLGLAVGNPALAAGATLLFVSNIVFIIVSEYVVLLWLGMRPRRGRDATIGIAGWWAFIGSLLLGVLFLLAQLTQQAQQISNIQSFMLDRLPAADFVDMQTSSVTNDPLDVLLTVRTPQTITPQIISELQQDLRDEFNREINLQVAAIAITGTRSDQEALVTDTLREFFADATIQGVTLLSDPADDLLIVEAVVRTNSTLTADTVRGAEQALQARTERTVQLTIVPQQVLRVDTPPEVTPEATPEITPEPTG